MYSYDELQYMNKFLVNELTKYKTETKANMVNEIQELENTLTFTKMQLAGYNLANLDVTAYSFLMFEIFHLWDETLRKLKLIINI